MARPSIYSEPKGSVNYTLTATARKWLEAKKEELGANSVSDTIERMARNVQPGLKPQDAD